MSLAVASRYANALVDVVLDPKNGLTPDSAVQALLALEQIIDSSPELHHVLLSPAVTASQKHKVMARLCDALDVPKLIRNFIFIVVRNRRSNLFPMIRTAFERLLDERQGWTRAEISSATALSDHARASVEAQLARISGKRIRAQYAVNPDLLGGVVARIGSRLYDGSVRGELDAMRRKLVLGA